jgi:hypothetical protein
MASTIETRDAKGLHSVHPAGVSSVQLKQSNDKAKVVKYLESCISMLGCEKWAF